MSAVLIIAGVTFVILVAFYQLETKTGLFGTKKTAPKPAKEKVEKTIIDPDLIPNDTLTYGKTSKKKKSKEVENPVEEVNNFDVPPKEQIIEQETKSNNDFDDDFADIFEDEPSNNFDFDDDEDDDEIYSPYMDRYMERNLSDDIRNLPPVMKILMMSNIFDKKDF